MKTEKLIKCLLTMLLLCVSLTACEGMNEEQPEQNAVQVEAEQKEKDSDDGDQAEREQVLYDYEEDAEEDGEAFFPGDVDDGVQSEREQELYEREENAENEYNQNQEQQAGSYEHHVGDAVFYTEHDLQKYIVPKATNPEHKWLDIDAMIYDVWGTDVGILQVSNGYAASDGSSFIRAVSYDYVGENTKTNAGYDAKSYYFIVSGGDEEQQCETDVTIYNEERPSGDWLVVKGDSRGFGFSPDSAALLLYVLEQTESNPRSNISGELGLPSNYECTY